MFDCGIILEGLYTAHDFFAQQVSAVVFALGLESNPEMKRSVMAWIARHTTNVTCSKKIISLEFFGYFLFQDKKYR